MTRKNATYGTAGLKTVMNDDGKLVGQFEAIVAGFGNVDLQGDVTMPGSWDNSLDRWKSAGERIPVVWSHDWGDPLSFVGSVDPNDVVAVPDVGYKVRGELDLATERGSQVYKLLGGYGDPALVKEFSFAYDVKAEEMITEGKHAGANALTELDIIELGPTLKGANSDAVLLGVKSDTEVQTKAVDSSAWDGQAAMTKCAAADNPAAAFRAVCAGRRDGPPDQAGTWALPHHKSPGAPPNAAGVAAAMGRLGQTQGLTNAAAAKSHLEAHQREVAAEKSLVNDAAMSFPVSDEEAKRIEGDAVVFSNEQVPEWKRIEPDGEKVGRVLSGKHEKVLRDAMSAIESVLSALGEEVPKSSGAKNDPEPAPAQAEDSTWVQRVLVDAGLDGDEVSMTS